MARQLGLNEKNLEVLLERTGLSVDELMDDDTLLSKRQQLQIVRNAMSFCRKVSFPIHKIA